MKAFGYFQKFLTYSFLVDLSGYKVRISVMPITAILEYCMNETTRIIKMDVSYMCTFISLKMDVSYMCTFISLKMDVSYMCTFISLKMDVSYMCTFRIDCLPKILLLSNLYFSHLYHN